MNTKEISDKQQYKKKKKKKKKKTFQRINYQFSV